MNEPILEMKHLTMGFGGLELFSDIKRYNNKQSFTAR